MAGMPEYTRQYRGHSIVWDVRSSPYGWMGKAAIVSQPDNSGGKHVVPIRTAELFSSEENARDGLIRAAMAWIDTALTARENDCHRPGDADFLRTSPTS
jgi:hypothetical protein